MTFGQLPGDPYGLPSYSFLYYSRGMGNARMITIRARNSEDAKEKVAKLLDERYGSDSWEWA